MWRRTYLLLLLIRVYFAFSPSYLHPDEHFQGPEVFAGRILSYPARLTWEFTTERPIRSVFPLWPVYGVPMNLLQWFYHETDTANPPPSQVYYVLRGVMFLLSFVLEDWAVYELVPSPRHRLPAIVLVASSYVTWTYQTHTFSNSLETLLVLWGLVLVQRILESKQHSSFFSAALLAFIAVAGVFNRITFPAFFVIPGLQLLPHLWRKSIALFTFLGSGVFFLVVAVLVDTSFYTRPKSLFAALQAPVITPINNLLYNSDTANLATHGLHPHYQHFLANLPQLLGPVYIAMIASLFTRPLAVSWLKDIKALSALSATMILSIFPHQEPRFLIPCVPLLLSCFRLRRSRLFLVAWILFNGILGFLMGVYHQGGVVPTQLAIPTMVSVNLSKTQRSSVDPSSGTTPIATVFWWKTYSPPLWLLGDNTSHVDIETRDLMGVSGSEMIQTLEATVPSCAPSKRAVSAIKKASHGGVSASASASAATNQVFLVAPKSASFLDDYIPSSAAPSTPNHDRTISSGVLDIRLHELWSYSQHINLDDLDFDTDGILDTLKRVVGRRGLGVWAVRRTGCA